MRRRTMVLAGLMVIVSSLGWCEPSRWLNIEVNEQRKATEIKVHVPVALVTAVLGAVDSAEPRGGRVKVSTGHADVDWQAVLQALRKAEEGQYVSIKDRQADVRVRKVGGLVEVEVDEHNDGGDHVRMRFPVELADALSIEDDTLDLKSFVARIGTTSGELLRLESRDANVRIWVE